MTSPRVSSGDVRCLTLRTSHGVLAGPAASRPTRPSWRPRWTCSPSAARTRCTSSRWPRERASARRRSTGAGPAKRTCCSTPSPACAPSCRCRRAGRSAPTSPRCSTRSAGRRSTRARARLFALLQGEGVRYPRLMARYVEIVVKPRREMVTAVLRRGVADRRAAREYRHRRRRIPAEWSRPGQHVRRGPLRLAPRQAGGRGTAAGAGGALTISSVACC